MNILETIESRRQARLELRTHPYPRNNPIASDLSDCVRETVLGIKHWRERPRFEPHVVARLERGSKIEDWIMLELQQLGFTVRAERTPFQITDSQGRIVCRGKVDGFISDGFDNVGKPQETPFEVKSMLPFIYDKINCLDDFSRFHWTRKYPRQLQTYLYANNMTEGFFLLDDCLGHWKLIPVTLDYEEMERILRQCEAAVEHLGNDTLPDFHTDPSVCRKCWAFGRVCDPPGQSGEGIMALEDYEMEAKLSRRAELEASYREYMMLDKQVKERFRGQTNILVGDWFITGEERTRNEKAREARATTYWQANVENVGANGKADHR